MSGAVDATPTGGPTSLAMASPHTALTHVTDARRSMAKALHPATLGAYPKPVRRDLAIRLRRAAAELDAATGLLDRTPGAVRPAPTPQGDLT